MADSELADLTEATSLAGDEWVYVVDDPSGTPVDRKARAWLLARAMPLDPSLVYTPGMAATGNQSTVASELKSGPLIHLPACTIDAIACNVSTLAASSTVRLGLYKLPDSGVVSSSTLVVDAGTVDSSTTGAKSIAVSQAVTAGWYLPVYAAQGGTPGLTGWANVDHPTIGNTAANLTGRCGYISGTATAGALPATFGTVTPNNAAGRVVVSVS